jgi:hypothetical protein
MVTIPVQDLMKFVLDVMNACGSKGDKGQSSLEKLLESAK